MKDERARALSQTSAETVVSSMYSPSYGVQFSSVLFSDVFLFGYQRQTQTCNVGLHLRQIQATSKNQSTLTASTSALGHHEAITETLNWPVFA